MKFQQLSMGLIALSFAAASHASGPVTVEIDGVAQTLTSVSDQFAGAATLSKTCGFIPINLNCTLTLGGVISDDGSSTTTLTIENAISGTSSLCSGVTFNIPTPPTTGGATWVGTAPHSALPTSASDLTPVPFTVSGIQVSTSCGNCAGSLGATFSNTGPGTFSFNGSLPYTGGGLPGACNVAGSSITSTSGTDYKVYH